jgi:hypothetical protein
MLRVENSQIAKDHPDVLSPLTHTAFKYISMTLASRAKSPEFNGIQFLVRNYQDNRWDKRLTIPAEQLQMKPAEHRFSVIFKLHSGSKLHFRLQLDPVLFLSNYGSGNLFLRGMAELRLTL